MFCLLDLQCVDIYQNQPAYKEYHYIMISLYTIACMRCVQSKSLPFMSRKIVRHITQSRIPEQARISVYYTKRRTRFTLWHHKRDNGTQP